MLKDCSFYTAKYLLCFFNFIFLVLSTIIFAAAVWFLIDKASFIALLNVGEMEDLDDPQKAIVIQQTGYLLIGLSSVLMFLSFLGTFGSIRESRCMLGLYAILSIVLFCAEVVTIGLAYHYQDFTRSTTKKFLRESLLTYYSSPEQTDIITLTWNKMMSEMNCCGVDNYIDLDIAKGWLEHKGNRTIPEVCCIFQNVSDLIPRDINCVINPNEGNSNFKTGCYDMLIDWLIKHREIILVIILGINIGLFLGIFSSLYLWKTVRRIQRLRL